MTQGYVGLVGVVGVGLVAISLVRVMMREISLRSKILVKPKKLEEMVVRLGLAADKVVLVDDDRVVAEVVGWWKPRIILGKRVWVGFSRQEVEAILLHEKFHLVSDHSSWGWVMRLVGYGFWSLPVVAGLRKMVELEWELAADRFVVETQGTRRYLRASMRKVLSSDSIPPADGLGFGDAMEQRVRQLSEEGVVYGLGLMTRVVVSSWVLVVLGLSTVMTQMVYVDQVGAAGQEIPDCREGGCQVVCRVAWPVSWGGEYSPAY